MRVTAVLVGILCQNTLCLCCKVCESGLACCRFQMAHGEADIVINVPFEF